MADEKKFQLTASMRSLRYKALVSFRDQLKDMPPSVMFSEDEKNAALADLDILILHSPAKIIQKPREKKSSGTADKAPAKAAAKK